MSTVQPTDTTLVQRGTAQYSANADLAAAQDADLILVNRAGTDYKCTIAEWKASQAKVNKPSITTPASGAVDVGDMLAATSSAFSATGGATHVSSDWQITLKADTAFAAPAVQSMASTTDKTSWSGGPLQADKDYLIRVRHNGSGGLVSPWSDVVGFKTKTSFIATLPASDFLVSKDSVTWTPITAPVKFINVSTNYDTFFGFGTDGALYKIPAVGGAAVSKGSFVGLPAGRTALQGGCGYNGSITIIDSQGGLHGYGNVSYEPNPAGPLTSIPAAEAALLSTSTNASDTAVALSNTLKKAYVFSPTAGWAVTLDGKTATSVAGWREAPEFSHLFTQRPGKQIVRFMTTQKAGGYLDQGTSFVLYEDGVVIIGGTYTLTGPYKYMLSQVPAAYGTYDCQVNAIKVNGDHFELTQTGYEVAIGALTGKGAESALYSLGRTGPGIYVKGGKWFNKAGADLGYKAPPAGGLSGFVPFVGHRGTGDTLILPKAV